VTGLIAKESGRLILENLSFTNITAAGTKTNNTQVAQRHFIGSSYVFTSAPFRKIILGKEGRISEQSPELLTLTQSIQDLRK
jgi:hypothetical protein